MTQTPTRDPQIYDQLDQVVLWVQDQLDNAVAFVQIQNDLEAALLGAYTSDSLDLMKSDRATLSGLISQAALQAKLLPILQEIMRSDGQEPSDDVAALMQRWRELLTSDADSFQTRGITYGVGGAVGDGFIDAGGTGNGAIYRVTEDWDGVDREGITAETKRWECVADQQSGTNKHEESFRVVNTAGASPDNMEQGTANGRRRAGLDLDEEIAARSSGNSEAIIQNPSFSEHAGAVPTAGNNTVLANADDLTGYTIDTPANVEISVDQTYREIPGEATSRALYLTDNVQIQQVIRNTTNFSFERLIPYFRAIALYRDNNADGDFNYDLGSDTYQVDVSTLNNAAWNLIIPPRDQSLFYDNFRTDDITLNLQWSSRTTGEIYLDDQVIVAMDPLDGTWYVILGGSTPFQTEKVFTVQDTESTSPLAKIARVIWLAFGGDGYLITSGTPTRSDP